MKKQTPCRFYFFSFSLLSFLLCATVEKGELSREIPGAFPSRVGNGRRCPSSLPNTAPSPSRYIPALSEVDRRKRERGDIPVTDGPRRRQCSGVATWSAQDHSRQKQSRQHLFRAEVWVPVDPLQWQISQETANAVVARVANTVGAAESVLRVAATGHDNRLFLKVVLILYVLSTLGRLASGATIAYAGLCLACLYAFMASLIPSRSDPAQYFRRKAWSSESGRL